jgi:crotonobetainyl-CoA:carnitine CoA-transferase CaiB-like acyl-CoA transferase
VKIYTNPIKFSDTPIDRYTAPPTQGQHNDEVYKGLLEFDDAELERLKAAGII